jgi:hypothetical protein
MADLPHPANTAPASRQWFYVLSGLLATVLPVLAQAGVLPPEASLGGVIGGAGALTAGAVVSKQRREGLHDEVDPIDQVIAASQQILEEQQTANANADKLRQVMSGNFVPPVQSTVIPDFPAASQSFPVAPQTNNQVQATLDAILGAQ